MKSKEEKVVDELKKIIKSIENGELDIVDYGTSVRVNQTSISTEGGVVSDATLQFEIDILL